MFEWLVITCLADISHVCTSLLYFKKCYSKKHLYSEWQKSTVHLQACPICLCRFLPNFVFMQFQIWQHTTQPNIKYWNTRTWKITLWHTACQGWCHDYILLYIPYIQWLYSYIHKYIQIYSYTYTVLLICTIHAKRSIIPKFPFLSKPR